MCWRKTTAASVPDPAVVDALDEFWPMFVASRSLSVYLPETLLGNDRIVPGPFYRATTPYEFVQMKSPVTQASRNAHNRIGAWTNENGLIRLWAILESHGLTKPIREAAPHSKEMQLLKRLRQHFAHGSGTYDSRKKKHRKLRKDLLAEFPVPGNPDGIPLDIDRVLLPMFERCRVYAIDVLSKG